MISYASSFEAFCHNLLDFNRLMMLAMARRNFAKDRVASHGRGSKEVAQMETVFLTRLFG